MHKWEDEKPYCIYVLLHPTTEPASKAKLDLFTNSSCERLWRFSSTDSLIPINNPIPQQYNLLATKFKEAIDLYSSIVPSAVLGEVREHLNAQANQLEVQIQAAEKGELEVVAFLNHIHIENLKLVARLSEMQCTYQKDVTKETQRNGFCYGHLQSALDELGFIAKPTIEQSDICLFGKSLMDLYFYQEHGSTVSSALVKKLRHSGDDDDSLEWNESVVGGVAEFKHDDGEMKSHYAQTFADMVRVGTHLIHGALMRGKIIDKLVVYGLLTEYTSGLAYVMKYYVNFYTDECIFFVGEEIKAVRGLVGIIQAMREV